jgi:hypothetical protein
MDEGNGPGKAAKYQPLVLLLSRSAGGVDGLTAAA